MRFVTYLDPEGPRAAAVGPSGLVDLNRTDPSLPVSVRGLLRLGQKGLLKAAAALGEGSPFPRHSVRLLPAIPDPSKIICIGLNYADHAAESGCEVPDEPVVFSKFPSALCADGDEIVLPEECTSVDYEAELVAVIGKTARRVAPESAQDYVAGYLCGNDVSARDWQLGKPAGQWLLGKTFDRFAPIGPELVTAEEIPDPGNLDIRLRLNGKTMQDSNTSQFLFSLDQLVAYLSNVMTLEPGDLIFTGTPPGVGMGRKPQLWLKPGDTVEVEIERIGTLTNRCVADE